MLGRQPRGPRIARRGLDDEQPVGVLGGAVDLADRAAGVERERAPSIGVGGGNDRAHDPRALALVKRTEAAEVGRSEADRGPGVAERPLEGPVEAGEQVDPGAAEQFGPDAEQGAVHAEVLPVVALAERRQEARRLARTERQPEGVVGPDQSCSFGGCGHRRHPRIDSAGAAGSDCARPGQWLSFPWLTDWSIGFRPPSPDERRCHW